MTPCSDAVMVQMVRGHQGRSLESQTFPLPSLVAVWIAVQLLAIWNTWSLAWLFMASSLSLSIGFLSLYPSLAVHRPALSLYWLCLSTQALLSTDSISLSLSIYAVSLYPQPCSYGPVHSLSLSLSLSLSIYSLCLSTPALLSIDLLSLQWRTQTVWKNKKGTFCTTWGPTSAQKAMMHHVWWNSPHPHKD